MNLIPIYSYKKTLYHPRTHIPAALRDNNDIPDKTTKVKHNIGT